MIISPQNRQLLAAGGHVILWNPDLSDLYEIDQPESIEGIALVVTDAAITHVGGHHWQRVTVRAINHG